MKNKRKQNTITTVAVIALAGAAAYIVAKELAKRKQRKKVAVEGYETAPDILYPESEKKLRKMHYGPVLPHHVM